MSKAEEKIFEELVFLGDRSLQIQKKLDEVHQLLGNILKRLEEGERPDPS